MCVGYSEMCLSGCRGEFRCGKMSNVKGYCENMKLYLWETQSSVEFLPRPRRGPGQPFSPLLHCRRAADRPQRHHLPGKAWPGPALGRGLGLPRLHGRPLAQEEGGARLSLCPCCSGGTETHQPHGLVCSPMRPRDLAGSGVRKQQAHTAVLWGLSTSKEHSWDGWVCPPLS